jgi:hypothetical protein
VEAAGGKSQREISGVGRESDDSIVIGWTFRRR